MGSHAKAGRWLLLPLLLLLPFCRGAAASYAIPYELRLGPRPEDRFTALVILADYFGHDFGEEDDLRSLMLQNDHGDGSLFVKPYLPQTFEWYVRQVEARPQIYGANTAAMVSALRAHHAKSDGISAVIITEHNQLHRPLAMLRIAPAGEDGMVPTERQFLGRGLTERLPTPKPRWRWNRIADVRAQPGQPSFFDVTRPTRERLHHWLEGENLEFKNFAMDEQTKRKFLRYLYHIAWSHKMFVFGSRTFPVGIGSWHDGTPLDAETALGYGRRASHVWLGNYGGLLMRVYRSFGFRVYRVINNEHTWNENVYLMRAPVRTLARRMRQVAARTLERRKGERFWLVYDAALSAQLRDASCVGRLISPTLAW